ncbi:MAG: heparinase II/III family protein [Bacteriovorax sp.]|nr:heparinase II/III family protein [Bacteriovorax sp.]
MNKSYRLFAFFLFIGCSTSTHKVSSLHQHPRLYIHQEDLDNLKNLVIKDTSVKSWYEQLEKESKKILQEPSVEYKLVGPRLLTQSRNALKRISTLAGLYLIDGDRKKAERAKVELLAAARLKDWNPSHFLDVAEMTHAMAIGYDWLFSYLSNDDKKIIREAIITHGLNEGIKAYAKPEWWVKSTTNWNQVCNAGLSLGAMAVAEDNWDQSFKILTYAKNSLPIAMSKYATDGGDPEGVNYWRYGTSYNIYFLDALKTAFDNKEKVDDSTLKDTGYFRIYSLGPINKPFNFSDANDDRGTSPQMLWLASRFNNNNFSNFEKKIKNNPTIFNLIWSLKQSDKKNETPLPLNRLFKSIDVSFFRSSWTDSEAQFVGFKGGDNKANHSHLDLGSFVYDLAGQRWAFDLGPDDYNLPGYFDRKKGRWNYLKLINSGHNTLTINDENQKTTAAAPILKFSEVEPNPFAVVDLKEAYGAHVESAKRGIKILSAAQILIQDEIIPKTGESLDIKWNMLTKAKIKIADKKAELMLDGKIIEAEIIAPLGAHFIDEKINSEVHSLRIHLENQKQLLKIIVKLGSIKNFELKEFEIKDW